MIACALVRSDDMCDGISFGSKKYAAMTIWAITICARAFFLTARSTRQRRDHKTRHGAHFWPHKHRHAVFSKKIIGV